MAAPGAAMIRETHHFKVCSNLESRRDSLTTRAELPTVTILSYSAESTGSVALGHRELITAPRYYSLLRYYD
eukprot:16440-Hanusia_phi.AAC.1